MTDFDERQIYKEFNQVEILLKSCNSFSPL